MATFTLASTPSQHYPGYGKIGGDLVSEPDKNDLYTHSRLDTASTQFSAWSHTGS